MKSRWIEHQGKKIFLIDISHFSSADEVRSELAQAAEITTQQPLDSLLVLTDIRETIVTSSVLRVAEESSAKTTKHVHKTAVIGVGGFRRALMDIVSAFSGQRFSAFDDVEKAKNWLVSSE